MERGFDPRIRSPFNMIISGPSQSGKSTFVANLLKYRNRLFKRPPKKIVMCYGSTWQSPLFDNLRRDYGVHFIQGLPTVPIEKLFPPKDRPGLLILDDLMSQVKNSDEVCDLFTKGTHHNDTSCIYIAQNPFPGGKYGRTMSVNSHYNVLMKNPRDKVGVRTFLSQGYPKRSAEAFKAYQDATNERDYGYLFVDQHPLTPEAVRLQSRIIPGEGGPVVHIFSDDELPQHLMPTTATRAGRVGDMAPKKRKMSRDF